MVETKKNGKTKKLISDLERFNVAAERAKEMKSLIGEEVEILKGPNALKRAKVTKVMVEGLKPKFLVLVKNRTADDIYGEEIVSGNRFKFVNEALNKKQKISDGLGKFKKLVNVSLKNARKMFKESVKAKKKIDTKILKELFDLIIKTTEDINSKF